MHFYLNFNLSYIAPDDCPKWQKHVAYMNVHCCVRRHLTVYVLKILELQRYFLHLVGNESNSWCKNVFVCFLAQQPPPSQWPTVGITPPDQWSARRRDPYLTTHTTLTTDRNTCPPVGFEPTISAGEPPMIYALDRVATGSCCRNVCVPKIGPWRKCFSSWFGGAHFETGLCHGSFLPGSLRGFFST